MKRLPSGRTSNRHRLSRIEAGEATERRCDSSNKIWTQKAKKAQNNQNSHQSVHQILFVKCRQFVQLSNNTTHHVFLDPEKYLSAQFLIVRPELQHRLVMTCMENARITTTIDFKLRQKTHLQFMELLLVIKLCIQMN